MKRNGRPRVACPGFVTSFVYILSFIALAGPTEYGVPIEIKLWDSQRSPLSHMVDVSNEFGLKVLAEHNFLNDNNIAFSPYGLMGILVALYEGVDGESSYQIQRSMQLPWNRNVMRIGFRDIHRTLKTYFVPEEGFLAGLALNNENVTFNEPYVKILRFYGFDLETDKTTSKSPESTNTTTMAPSSSEITTQINNMNTVLSNDASLSSSTMSSREETTPSPNAETVDIQGPKESTISSTITSTLETTTATSTLRELATTTTTQSMQTTTQSMESTSQSSTAEPQPPIETSTLSKNVESLSTEGSTSTAVDVTTAISQTTILDTTTSSDVNTMLNTLSNTPTEALTTENSTITSTPGSTIETSQRRKRSLVDFIYTSPPYVEVYEAYRSFAIGSPIPESINDDDKMFSVNGLRNIEVTYMHYDSVLDHAYLPHLEASALRLPLDSERYYLLVVLPMRKGIGELGRLLARMARESDLSDVYSALRPCRVRAAVPSFVVKGHVTLTTDLQKLGMRDVFEPRQHDFTPMTHQPGVYVRSIEQAVSVAIRKYQTPNPSKAYIPNPNIVYFSATYPFLYFVMDANIHVALMAGKMTTSTSSSAFILPPLNVT